MNAPEERLPPELTVRRFTGYAPTVEGVCVDCGRPARLVDGDELLEHLEEVADGDCPELTRRAAMRAHLDTMIDRMSADFIQAPVNVGLVTSASGQWADGPTDAYADLLRGARLIDEHRGYEADLADRIQARLLAQVAGQRSVLEQVLSQLEPDQRLCVHGLECLTESNTDFLHDNQLRIRWRQEWHVLGPGGTCTSGSGSRTEYGPKP